MLSNHFSHRFTIHSLVMRRWPYVLWFRFVLFSLPWHTEMHFVFGAINIFVDLLSTESLACCSVNDMSTSVFFCYLDKTIKKLDWVWKIVQMQKLNLNQNRQTCWNYTRKMPHGWMFNFHFVATANRNEAQTLGQFHNINSNWN